MQGVLHQTMVQVLVLEVALNLIFRDLTHELRPLLSISSIDKFIDTQLEVRLRDEFCHHIVLTLQTLNIITALSLPNQSQR